MWAFLVFRSDSGALMNLDQRLVRPQAMQGVVPGRDNGFFWKATPPFLTFVLRG